MDFNDSPPAPRLDPLDLAILLAVAGWLLVLALSTAGLWPQAQAWVEALPMVLAEVVGPVADAVAGVGR